MSKAYDGIIDGASGLGHFTRPKLGKNFFAAKNLWGSFNQQAKELEITRRRELFSSIRKNNREAWNVKQEASAGDCIWYAVSIENFSHPEQQFL